MQKILIYILLFFCGANAVAQEILTGHVTDSRTDEPLIGVAIQVKGSSVQATVTDVDGKFSLPLKGEPPYAVVVSLVGYVQQELKVYDTSSEVDVELRENSQMLNEVVVVGYGTAKARDVV